MFVGMIWKPFFFSSAGRKCWSGERRHTIAWFAVELTGFSWQRAHEDINGASLGVVVVVALLALLAHSSSRQRHQDKDRRWFGGEPDGVLTRHRCSPFSTEKNQVPVGGWCLVASTLAPPENPFASPASRSRVRAAPLRHL